MHISKCTSPLLHIILLLNVFFITGVCHADELMYLFPIHFLKYPLSEQDIEMSKLIIRLWTNFATSGWVMCLALIFSLVPTHKTSSQFRLAIKTMFLYFFFIGMLAATVQSVKIKIKPCLFTISNTMSTRFANTSILIK